MTPHLPRNPFTITPIQRIRNKAEAEAKYGMCDITIDMLQEAVKDLGDLFDMDTFERKTDPDREEAKMVLAHFMLIAGEVLKDHPDIQ